MPENPLNLDPIWHLPSFLGSNGTYEQGDTGHNTFTLLYCGWREIALKKHYFRVLTTQDGWPRRSPNANRWYGRAKRCSRDLLTPCLIYAAFRHDLPHFSSLLCAMAKHGFLFANNTIRNHVYEHQYEHTKKATPDVPWRPNWKLPDLLGPDIWAILLRGMCLRSPRATYLALYPTLCALDVQNLLAALWLRLWGRQGICDERNLALKVHFSGTYRPTLVSSLTMWLYGQTKPCDNFKAYWTQPGQPRVDLWMCKLFSKSGQK